MLSQVIANKATDIRKPVGVPVQYVIYQQESQV
jgi:hypothetical protein